MPALVRNCPIFLILSPVTTDL